MEADAATSGLKTVGKMKRFYYEDRSFFRRWCDLEEDDQKTAPPTGIIIYTDLLEKAWGWDRLLPIKGPVEWSDYCNYLQLYYKRHASIIAQVTLVDAAETCLKKEDELVSLWDTKVKECIGGILPRNTFILSSLIQEFVGKVKCTGEGLSDASTAALLCITKEADLICDMLSRGANPEDYLIIQSTQIRICALSLINNPLCDSVAAAATMVGVMKEAIKICDWMRKNNEHFNMDAIDLDNDLHLSSQGRMKTLHVMIRMLEKSPFPHPAAGHKLVKEKSSSGKVPGSDGNGIAPAEASNTGGNTQDEEKITGAYSKKRRMKDVIKKVNDQELGSRQSRSKLHEERVRNPRSAASVPLLCHSQRASERGGRRRNLGLGNDRGVPLRQEHLLVGSSEDFDSSFEDAKTVPPVGIMKGIDLLEKTWGWDRLLPFKSSIEWSDYCIYLRQYYKRNASVISEVTGSSVVAAAEVCLNKELELVSLWKTRVLHFPGDILPVSTIIQSNLIQERACSIICATEGEFSVASNVALECIAKEADLTCELLKHGAEPKDDIIQQSGLIRMCALSLMRLQGSQAVDASAAMMGITKECKLISDWIKKENKLITFSMFFPRHELEECCLVRIRTLDVMLSILKGSCLPTSELWHNLMANTYRQ